MVISVYIFVAATLAFQVDAGIFKWPPRINSMSGTFIGYTSHAVEYYLGIKYAMPLYVS